MKTFQRRPPDCSTAFRLPKSLLETEASWQFSTAARGAAADPSACGSSGHKAAAPPISVMNTRRRMCPLPQARERAFLRGYKTRGVSTGPMSLIGTTDAFVGPIVNV